MIEKFVFIDFREEGGGGERERNINLFHLLMHSGCFVCVARLGTELQPWCAGAVP